MNNLISVIIPIYNVEDYLSKCIESVCEQTYSNIEVILVDDGSNDKSPQICDQYAKGDSRIIVIHKKNGGLTTARKVGLQASHGEYIGFVDGDDWIESEMYEEMIRHAVAEEVPLVVSGMYRENGGIVYAEWKSGPFEEGLYEGDKLYCLKQSLFEMNGSSCNKLFKKDMLYELLMNINDGLAGVEDDLFSLEYILKASKIYIMDKAFYHGVERSTSATHSVHKDWYFQMHIAIQHYNAMMVNFPDAIFIEKCQKNIANKLMSGIRHICENIFIPQYWYEDIICVEEKKDIIIYGGGVAGENYYYWASKVKKIRIVGWVDTYASQSKLTQHTLDDITSVLTKKYDSIVIAVKNEKIVVNIKHELLSMGIDESRIKWGKPHMLAVFAKETS